jgi:hypothetical protein
VYLTVGDGGNQEGLVGRWGKSNCLSLGKSK